ncbi:MAG: LPP20 family lipoprotein [Thiotrichaceae bacterium]|nr:LPP20 family lipoprotein [Thiotrichaceae bacterium]
MNKFLPRSIMTMALIAGLAACSSTPKQEVAAVPDCTFPDVPEVAAPDWVCDMPVPDVPVSAVGSFRATKAGHQFQKTQAVASARNALAAQMKVHVKQLIKSYVETTGVGDDETVDAVTSDVSKQITNETLYGTRTFKIRKSPGGVLYVLVGMDPEASIANAQDALKTSYKNQKALWQRMMSDKAHGDLDAEIEKIASQ